MSSLLQTELWADFKALQGWKKHQIVLTPERPIFILERALFLGKSLLYAPEVSFTQVQPAQIKDLVAQAHSLSKSALAFRLELLEPTGNETSMQQAGFIKSFEEVQPEHRQIVDIVPDQEIILKQMKEKGRYNVRLAQRHEVKTRISTDMKDIEVFYHLFKTTADRNGFTIRSKTYFDQLATMLFTNNVGEIVIAEYNNKPLCALIITYYDGMASYLYGASSNEDRQTMAPYLAHYAAIQSAKSRGCHSYDLLQVAPEGANEKHHYAQLTQFKQRFGGQRVDLLGSWDYVLQPMWYSVFKTAQKIRRR
jgi:lipid II:glycine glycyltransferase (peptidoglycan interpeptide bridge formation enzyme)